MADRALLLALLLGVTSLAACVDDMIIEPAAPAAHGVLSLDVDVDPLEWMSLETRFAATDHLDDDDPGDGEGSGGLEDLAEIEFPFDYWVGGGFGTSSHSEWRVLVWLSNDDAEAEREFWDEVPEGSPWAEAIVDLGDCSQGCGAAEVDLFLAW